MAFRSVPLIQRGDASAFGSTRSTRDRMSGDRSARSSRHATRLSEVGTADFGRSRLAEGQSVSAYAGESGVVGVSRRHERWTVVSGEQTHTKRRQPAQEAEQVEPVNRRKFVEDYDDGAVAISGSESRRNAVIGALRAVPEAIGGAVLAGGAAVVSHIHRRGLLVMLALALTVAMLFSPVRNLYIAYRQLDTLQQTYGVLTEENDRIRSQIEALQTREGIENEARERGYVEPGETKVLVEGLDVEEGPSAAAEAVAELEVPDTRAWYIRLLDSLFGYDPAA